LCQPGDDLPLKKQNINDNVKPIINYGRVSLPKFNSTKMLPLPFPPVLRQYHVVCQGKDEFLKETEFRSNRKSPGVNGYFETGILGKVNQYYSKS